MVKYKTINYRIKSPKNYFLIKVRFWKTRIHFMQRKTIISETKMFHYYIIENTTRAWFSKNGISTYPLFSVVLFSEWTGLRHGAQYKIRGLRTTFTCFWINVNSLLPLLTASYRKSNLWLGQSSSNVNEFKP